MKYFPSKGKSGFIVWRFQLQRDDPIPAPWTKVGKERIAMLGLEMQVFIIVCTGHVGYVCYLIIELCLLVILILIFQVPEGYEKKMQTKKSGSSRKRSLKNAVLTERCEPAKKPKIKYSIEKEIALLIKKDVENNKLWNICKDMSEQGKQVILYSSCRESVHTNNCVCFIK